MAIKNWKEQRSREAHLLCTSNLGAGWATWSHHNSPAQPLLGC